MSYMLVNVLCACLVCSALAVVMIPSPKNTAYVYGVQSLILIAIFVTLGILTGSTELFTWSFTAFLTKVLFVPAVIIFAYKKMGEPKEDIQPIVKPAVTIILAVVEVLICFLVVNGIELPTAAETKPALAISLAHFFIGLTCIVTQRNIIKQMFGYCLMENGSHLTLAILAPTAPELVEIGIATDAIFAVLIMAIICVRVYKKTGTLNSDELMELKG